MDGTESTSKGSNQWQKTQYANLIRYVPTGIYFARIRVKGKLIRKSLKTDSITVAKLRLADLEKAERQKAETNIEIAGGKLTFGHADDPAELVVIPDDVSGPEPVRVFQLLPDDADKFSLGRVGEGAFLCFHRLLGIKVAKLAKARPGLVANDDVVNQFNFEKLAGPD